MNEINTILVPVDFDQHTDKLVAYALYVAKKFEANMHFFHVSEAFEGYERYEHPSFDEIEEGLRAHSQKEMNDLLERVRKEYTNCEGTVVNGDIVDEITRFAKEQNINLILIGTHGAKGLERIILGSVAERVLKGSTCPVLMFNPYH